MCDGGGEDSQLLSRRPRGRCIDAPSLERHAIVLNVHLRICGKYAFREGRCGDANDATHHLGDLGGGGRVEVRKVDDVRDARLEPRVDLVEQLLHLAAVDGLGYCLVV